MISIISQILPKKNTKEKEFVAIFSYEKKSNIIKEKIEEEVKEHVLNYLVSLSTMSIYAFETIQKSTKTKVIINGPTW